MQSATTATYATVKSKQNPAIDEPSVSINHWLKSLLLPQYEEVFIAAGLTTRDQCSGLTDDDLMRIGIAPAGHRKRILAHLSKLIATNNASSKPNSTASSTDQQKADVTPNALSHADVAKHTSIYCSEGYADGDGGNEEQEIYDIPPRALVKKLPMQVNETLYANVEEYNNIPVPMLPPKRQSSKDSSFGKFGIADPAELQSIKRGNETQCGVLQENLKTQPSAPVPLPRGSVSSKVFSDTREVASILMKDTATVDEVTSIAADKKPKPKPRNLKPLDDRSSSASVTTETDAPKYNKYHCLSSEFVEGALSSSSLPTNETSLKKLNPAVELDLEQWVNSTKKSMLRSGDSTDVSKQDELGTRETVQVSARSCQNNILVASESIAIAAGSKGDASKDSKNSALITGNNVSQHCSAVHAVHVDSESLACFDPFAKCPTDVAGSHEKRATDDDDSCTYVDISGLSNEVADRTLLFDIGSQEVYNVPKTDPITAALWPSDFAEKTSCNAAQSAPSQLLVQEMGPSVDILAPAKPRLEPVMLSSGEPKKAALEPVKSLPFSAFHVKTNVESQNVPPVPARPAYLETTALPPVPARPNADMLSLLPAKQNVEAPTASSMSSSVRAHSSTSVPALPPRPACDPLVAGKTSSKQMNVSVRQKIDPFELGSDFSWPRGDVAVEPNMETPMPLSISSAVKAGVSAPALPPRPACDILITDKASPKAAGKPLTGQKVHPIEPKQPLPEFDDFPADEPPHNHSNASGAVANSKQHVNQASTFGFMDFAAERAQAGRQTYQNFVPMDKQLTPTAVEFNKGFDSYFNQESSTPANLFDTSTFNRSSLKFSNATYLSPSDVECQTGRHNIDALGQQNVSPHQSSTTGHFNDPEYEVPNLSAEAASKQSASSTVQLKTGAVQSPSRSGQKEHGLDQDGNVAHKEVKKSHLYPVLPAVIDQPSTFDDISTTRDSHQSRSSKGSLTDLNFSGYLNKANVLHGGLRTELLRRWCVLGNGSLNCFYSDRVTDVKEVFNGQDMLSVSLCFDGRFNNSFELRYIRRSSCDSTSLRNAVFAAESAGDCNLWMSVLAMNIATNIGCTGATLEEIVNVVMGGIALIRSVDSSLSTDWLRTWVHLSDKKFHIFSQHKEFEVVDLQKAIKTRIVQQLIDSTIEGPVVAIDLPLGRTLWIQAEWRQETEAWYNVLRNALLDTGADVSLSSQPLTAENVPIIVDKFIAFVVLHGMELEGIYRLSGQHSKIAQLLKSCQDDVRGVVLKLENYQIHDVTNALKRFFRTLDEPLLTQKMYNKWITAARIPDTDQRIPAYKQCLTELPPVNYATLRHLVIHLTRVVEKESMNKMSAVNIASIFGPILMKLDNDTQPPTDYGLTNVEINVMKDFIDHHRLLFEVNEEQLKREVNIEDAVKRIAQLNMEMAAHNPTAQSDLLFGIHVGGKDGQIVTQKVSVKMTAAELISCLLEKIESDKAGEKKWAIFETIADGDLERPLHYLDNIVDTTLMWGFWPMEISRTCFLCLKQNTIFDGAEFMYNRNEELFAELHYAAIGKKQFRQFYFELVDGVIRYRKDARGPVTRSWNIEDIIVYIGTQQARNPPTGIIENLYGVKLMENVLRRISQSNLIKYGLTFYASSENLSGSYFGHSICFDNEQELWQWQVAIYIKQYPEGLNSRSRRKLGAQVSNVGSVDSVLSARGSDSPTSRVRNITSKLQKLVKR